MPVNINEFKVFCDFVSNKVQSGNAVTPIQFNSVANRAQMQLFERDYNIFVASDTVTEYLQLFLANKSLLINNFGQALYPNNFQHTSSMRSYYIPESGDGYEVPVDKENNFDFAKLQRSQLFIPTKQFPKFSEFSTYFDFLPKNLGIAQLDYFKTPVAPVWGYTIVNNEEVYDPATSTNFEWDDFATNEVAAMYLSLIGVNLKDAELGKFAEMFKQQN